MCKKDYISSPKRGNTKWWMTNSHLSLVPEHPIPGQIRKHAKYKTPPFFTITTFLSVQHQHFDLNNPYKEHLTNDEKNGAPHHQLDTQAAQRLRHPRAGLRGEFGPFQEPLCPKLTHFRSGKCKQPPGTPTPPNPHQLTPTAPPTKPKQPSPTPSTPATAM